jgi:hypothetical protein
MVCLSVVQSLQRLRQRRRRLTVEARDGITDNRCFRRARCEGAPPEVRQFDVPDPTVPRVDLPLDKAQGRQPIRETGDDCRVHTHLARERRDARAIVMVLEPVHEAYLPHTQS